MSKDLGTRFVHYPNPKALEQPYRAPPPPKNPVIKGNVLHYLSNAYANMTAYYRPELSFTASRLYHSLPVCSGVTRASAR